MCNKILRIVILILMGFGYVYSMQEIEGPIEVMWRVQSRSIFEQCFVRTSFIRNSELKAYSQVKELKISSDGDNLVFLTTGQEVILWDLNNGVKRVSLNFSKALNQEGSNDIIFFDITSDEKYIVAQSRDFRVGVWDIYSGKQINLFLWDQVQLLKVMTNQNNERIALGIRKPRTLCSFSSFLIYNLDREESVFINEWEDIRSTSNCFSISQDGNYIALSFREGSKIKVYDLGFWKKCVSELNVNNNISSLDISRNGEFVVFASHDFVGIKKWNILLSKLMVIPTDQVGDVQVVSLVTGDWEYALATSRDYTIAVIDINEGCVTSVFDNFRSCAYSDILDSQVIQEAVSLDGQLAISGLWSSQDEQKKLLNSLWIVSSGKVIQKIPTSLSSISFAKNPKGFFAIDNGHICYWKQFREEDFSQLSLAQWVMLKAIDQDRSMNNLKKVCNVGAGIAYRSLPASIKELIECIREHE